MGLSCVLAWQNQQPGVRTEDLTAHARITPVFSKLPLTRFPLIDRELRLATGSPLIARFRSMVGVSRTGIGCIVSMLFPFGVDNATPTANPVCRRRGAGVGGGRMGVLSSSDCDCARASRTRSRSRSSSMRRTSSSASRSCCVGATSSRSLPLPLLFFSVAGKLMPDWSNLVMLSLSGCFRVG